MQTGRPTIYDPAICDELIDFMSHGYSFEAFAGHKRIGRSTLYEWVSTYPEFKEAKEIAFSACRLWWERMGVTHIVNTSEYDSESSITTSKTLNSSTWIFNMKNRFGWRDKVEHSTDPKKPIQLAYALPPKADKEGGK